jgi:hypothetical protein
VNGDQTNNDALFAGAVYVFVRAGSTWSQQAYLKTAGHQFERRLRFGRVWDDTVVIGAIGEGQRRDRR